VGFLNKKKKGADLMANGTKAVGTVLTVRDTGTTINNNPRIQMSFRIEPLDGSPAFDASKTKTVSRVEIPRQGDRYPVWFDQEDRDTWAFAIIQDDTGREMLRQQFGEAANVFVGMGAPPPPVAASQGQGQDTVAALATLADLHQQGLLTTEQFEQQRDKLLGQ
jgi:hypothetical protein